MNKQQLQLTLKKHGLKTDGNKKELIKRHNRFKKLTCKLSDFPHRQRSIEYMLKIKESNPKKEEKELFRIPMDTSLDNFRMIMDTSEDD